MAGRDLTVPRVTCWEQVVFLQGDDGRRIVDGIERVTGVTARGATERSIERAVAQLAENLPAWDVGEVSGAVNPLNSGEKRAGTAEGYVLTWHLGLGYVALDRPTLRRPEADCGCFPHVTYMTGFGFHCETEDQGYCNFECPHIEEESA